MEIAIYGLGAVGSNLLVQLAKQFPDFSYIGIDYDKVEDRNIRTQAYFLEHVGMSKADAMRIVLSRYLRKPKYTAVKTKVTAPVYPGIKGPDSDRQLAIDCFDNTASRKLFQNSGNILHIGFSPDYTAECLWHENYSVPNDVDPTKNDICSMGDAVGFIHFVVNAAVLNISSWVKTDKARDFLITKKSRLTWL